MRRQTTTILFVAMATLCGLTGSALARSFLWQLERPGLPPSYLFGSIHLGKKSFYPLAPAIERAFEKSAILVLEARTDQMAQAAALVMQKGMLMPPDSLRAVVSPKTYALALAKGKALGLPASAVDHMRPWLLGLTFSAKELQSSGYDPQWGIEAVLTRRRGKRRIEVLEGVEFQINLLSSFNAKEQEYFLIYSIEQAKLAAAFMKRMVTAWLRGDDAALSRQMSLAVRKTPELGGVYRRMVTERNVSMAKTITRMVAKERTALFFVVGAGHLVGKQNIPQLLRKQGFRLRRL